MNYLQEETPVNHPTLSHTEHHQLLPCLNVYGQPSYGCPPGTRSPSHPGRWRRTPCCWTGNCPNLPATDVTPSDCLDRRIYKYLSLYSLQISRMWLHLKYSRESYLIVISIARRKKNLKLSFLSSGFGRKMDSQEPGYSDSIHVIIFHRYIASKLLHVRTVEELPCLRQCCLVDHLSEPAVLIHAENVLIVWEAPHKAEGNTRPKAMLNYKNHRFLYNLQILYLHKGLAWWWNVCFSIKTDFGGFVLLCFLRAREALRIFSAIVRDREQMSFTGGVLKCGGEVTENECLIVIYYFSSISYIILFL